MVNHREWDRKVVSLDNYGNSGKSIQHKYYSMDSIPITLFPTRTIRTNTWKQTKPLNSLLVGQVVHPSHLLLVDKTHLVGDHSKVGESRTTDETHQRTKLVCTHTMAFHNLSLFVHTTPIMRLSEPSTDTLCFRLPWRDVAGWPFLRTLIGTLRRVSSLQF